MKYKVTIPFAVFVSVEVDAETPKEAEDIAFEDAYITGYCGNGGTDKLVGVSGSNVSIEAGELPLEGDDFKIEVEKL
ncbi:hypothetical protein [Acinetobacter sp.]|uniref:hypothetical protein n=1 Tax=Acinetobacter sp. TaxID=472 RepID=UPI003CFC3F10